MITRKIIYPYFVILISLISCAKNQDNENPDNITGQNISVLVAPNQTDAAYSVTNESHYVVSNTKTHLNKLLLFLGGSYSIPKNYDLFCNQSASFGFDVISLSYPNDVAAATLGSSSDLLVFDKYRDEICFGNPVSNDVSVNNLNCIVTRTIKLIIYLKNNFPNQNWEQYLTPTNTLNWSKIIVSGHSQGSGHACYLGKKNLTERVVMFSGPNDYHGYYNTAANWLTIAGLTPKDKQFVLLHSQDEVVPFANQVNNVRGLGLLLPNQNPLLVDNLETPFANAKILSLNITANSNHSATIGGNSKLPAIWFYLLTTN